MAQMIRQQEDLLTVFLSVDRERDGLRLNAKLFRGRETLGAPVRLPLSQLGYTPPERGVRGHQMCFPEPQVPPNLLTIFFEAQQWADEEEAVWLQIGYGADVLGAYPWEGLIGTELGRTLLRIPNFARNTYRRDDGIAPIAICAATPEAKDATDWRPAVHNLLAGFMAPNPVVLYLGENQAYGGFAPNELPETFPGLNISLAQQPDSADAPARERYISDRDSVTNPWLSWIADDLATRFDGHAHAVHMFCSGYSQDAHGALALPQSPKQDGDSRWARFVGVPEFAAFADQIDCQITGLTALGAARWREGLRLFANELAWKRPGPIVLDQGDGSAIRAYATLMGGQPFETTGHVTDTVLSVHPKAVFESAPDMAVTRRAQASDEGRADFSAELAYMEAFSEQPEEGPLPAELRRVMDRLSSARPKSVLRSAQDRGTLNALKFLQTLPLGKGLK